jgi:hypothetical protein
MDASIHRRFTECRVEYNLNMVTIRTRLKQPAVVDRQETHSHDGLAGRYLRLRFKDSAKPNGILVGNAHGSISLVQW